MLTNILESYFPPPRPSGPSSGCQLCQYRSCRGTSKTGSARFSRVYLWAALALQAVPAEFSWCFLFLLLLWMHKMQHRCAEGGFGVLRTCASRTRVFSTLRRARLFTSTDKPNVPKTPSGPTRTLDQLSQRVPKVSLCSKLVMEIFPGAKT